METSWGCMFAWGYCQDPKVRIFLLRKQFLSGLVNITLFDLFSLFKIFQLLLPMALRAGAVPVEAPEGVTGGHTFAFRMVALQKALRGFASFFRDLIDY